ncbi:MAG: molybdenum cofactor biosynthesis protein MoaE [Chloroflexi bacterium]|nr:molybdenum cofactor biosynthesis protein MoaE [Chloroflexota bacterium]
MFKITKDPIQIDPLISQVKKDEHGGIVTFIGTVRNNSNGKKVRYLEYDAYPEMAEKKFKQIATEIVAKWGIEDVAIVHRIGRMEVGDVVVLIVVGSPHRKEAFEACQYAIDTIKQIVPIWKKEVGEDGEVWIDDMHKH